MGAQFLFKTAIKADGKTSNGARQPRKESRPRDAPQEEKKNDSCKVEQ